MSTVDAAGHLSDHELVLGVEVRNETFLHEIMRRHAFAVHSLAKSILRDSFLAEDIHQSVFLGVWENPRRFSPDRGSLRSYLLTQCHGKCVDLIRSRNARAAREEKVFGGKLNFSPPVDTGMMKAAATTEVRAALAVLTPAEREVIELAFYGGHTYRRVAVLLGLPEGTVKTRIRSGLSRLYDALGQENYVNESEMFEPTGRG